MPIKSGNKIMMCKSKLRWRTPLQATGYVRATAQNSVKGNNNPKQFSVSRS
jgi:hypothetical protein